MDLYRQMEAMFLSTTKGTLFYTSTEKSVSVFIKLEIMYMIYNRLLQALNLRPTVKRHAVSGYVLCSLYSTLFVVQLFWSHFLNSSL